MVRKAVEQNQPLNKIGFWGRSCLKKSMLRKRKRRAYVYSSLRYAVRKELKTKELAKHLHMSFCFSFLFHIQGSFIFYFLVVVVMRDYRYARLRLLKYQNVAYQRFKYHIKIGAYLEIIGMWHIKALTQNEVARRLDSWPA
ncbi:uncharacterized protein LOC131233982 [Magnolia sinica]|uniref:uncharacterized protein LOC131233982 n=1 Tax=Magnolia sinica TaxID=86752 RepID=UPI002659786D|nr:uncharacterized protein LOC131233982 [Magnolia sinica]